MEDLEELEKSAEKLLSEGRYVEAKWLYERIGSEELISIQSNQKIQSLNNLLALEEKAAANPLSLNHQMATFGVEKMIFMSCALAIIGWLILKKQKIHPLITLSGLLLLPLGLYFYSTFYEIRISYYAKTIYEGPSEIFVSDQLTQPGAKYVLRTKGNWCKLIYKGYEVGWLKLSDCQNLGPLL
jgi:hypothetical protein